MAGKKKAAAKAEAPKVDAENAPEKAPLESPVSSTGAVNVYRADMGESLPPQKPAGVE